MENKRNQSPKLSSLEFNPEIHLASQQNVPGSDQLPFTCSYEEEEIHSSELQDDDNVFYPESVRELSDISAVNVLVQESSTLALKTLQMDGLEVQKVPASAKDCSTESKQKSSRSSSHKRFRDYLRIGKGTDTVKSSGPGTGSHGTQNSKSKSKNIPKLSSAFSSFFEKTASTFGMTKKKAASVSVMSGTTEHSYCVPPSKENVTQNLDVSDTVSFARSKSGPLPSISENLSSDTRMGESAASLGENVCSFQSSSGKEDHLKRKGSWLTVSGLTALFHRHTKTKAAGTSVRPSGDELVDKKKNVRKEDLSESTVSEKPPHSQARSCNDQNFIVQDCSFIGLKRVSNSSKENCSASQEPCTQICTDSRFVSSGILKKAKSSTLPSNSSVQVNSELAGVENSVAGQKQRKESHRYSMPSVLNIFSRKNSRNGHKESGCTSSENIDNKNIILQEIHDNQSSSSARPLVCLTEPPVSYTIPQYSSHNESMSVTESNRQQFSQKMASPENIDSPASSLQISTSPCEQKTVSPSHQELHCLRSLSLPCYSTDQLTPCLSLADDATSGVFSQMLLSVSSFHSGVCPPLQKKKLASSSCARKSSTLPKKKLQGIKSSSFVRFLLGRPVSRDVKCSEDCPKILSGNELEEKPNDDNDDDETVLTSVDQRKTEHQSGSDLNSEKQFLGNGRCHSVSKSSDGGNEDLRKGDSEKDNIPVESDKVNCQDKCSDKDIIIKVLGPENENNTNTRLQTREENVNTTEQSETKSAEHNAFIIGDNNIQDNIGISLENQKQQFHLKTTGFGDRTNTETVGGCGSDDVINNIGSRLKQLQASQDEWKSKVASKDAEKFTVKGKMSIRGKSPEGPLIRHNQSASSTSMIKDIHARAKSVSPESLWSRTSRVQGSKTLQASQPLLSSAVCSKGLQPKDSKASAGGSSSADHFSVEIPQFDDDIEVFFTSSKSEKSDPRDAGVIESLDIERGAFLQSAQRIRPQRKQATSGNPIRQLAQRSDILTSYTESRPNVTIGKELVKKVADVAKASGLAAEARAGLAAVEDLSQISLRKSESTLASSHLPYKEKMLVQFKGRRYCQPRLVKPCMESMNRGDSYVLVTGKGLHVWLGEFCNVIEKAKAIEFAKQVFKKHDLGCKAFNEPAVIDNESGSDYRQEKEFWTALCGDTKRVQLQDAGPADEDETYEDLINGTNVVYKFMDGCLRPFDQYCGKLLTCDALAPEVVLVIDFGAEMYVWIGKQSPKPDRVTALRQAGELWSQGYNYSAFKINPMSPFLDERSGGMPVKSSLRPVWGIFGRINQGTETLLFKDKFVDWGDSSRLIGAKGFSPNNALSRKTADCIQPCDVRKMIDSKREPVYLVLDGVKVGRETEWVEECDGLKMEYEVETEGVDVWHVAEFDHHLLDPAYHGHFDSGATYVVRWHYKIKVKGLAVRNRSVQSGRSRCVYFFWHGSNSSVTEKGACAMMTVELDQEKGPQIRVVQNKEPPCFLMLFKRRMIVHKGRKGSQSTGNAAGWHLYIVRNELPNEAYLMEVDVGAWHLRSRSSFLLLNAGTGQLTVWHGAKSPDCTKERARELRLNLQKWASLKLVADCEICVTEVSEGKENSDFLKAMKSLDRCEYDCLLNTSEIQNPSFSPSVPFSPFPVMQSDLLKSSQPALFLVDACEVVYLWQGYWSEENSRSGSAISQFNADRRCALETVLAYCQAINVAKPPPAYVVYAGVEPLCFTNLFPTWTTESSIHDSSMKDGRIMGEKTPVSEVLMQAAKQQYTLKELVQPPLPDGVDPLKLETYLSDVEFEEAFGRTKEDFYSLPKWKQMEAKKQLKLF